MNRCLHHDLSEAELRRPLIVWESYRWNDTQQLKLCSHATQRRHGVSVWFACIEAHIVAWNAIHNKRGTFMLVHAVTPYECVPDAFDFQYLRWSTIAKQIPIWDVNFRLLYTKWVSNWFVHCSNAENEIDTDLWIVDSNKWFELNSIKQLSGVDTSKIQLRIMSCVIFVLSLGTIKFRCLRKCSGFGTDALGLFYYNLVLAAKITQSFASYRIKCNFRR